MFNVGDEVRYLKTGANRVYRNQVGTIIKIQDGKKMVKFGDGHEMFVKAENMEILADKRPVGGERAAAVRKYALADFQVDMKVRYAGVLPSHSPELIGKIGVITNLYPPASIGVRWDDGTRGGRYYAGNMAPLDIGIEVAEAAPAPAPVVVVEEAPIAVDVAAVEERRIEVDAPDAPVPPPARAVDMAALYVQQQEATGWQVGDTVRIVRAVPPRYMGWDAHWAPNMDVHVARNTESKIKQIDGVQGILVGEYWYPWFSLEFVKPAEPVEVVKDFRLQGVNFVVRKNNIMIGEYNFTPKVIQALALAHAETEAAQAA